MVKYMIFFVIIFFCIFGGTAMKTGDWGGFIASKRITKRLYYGKTYKNIL